MPPTTVVNMGKAINRPNKLPQRTRISARQRSLGIEGRSEKAPEAFAQKMKRKIDSIKDRLIYSRRLGTAEPGFGNICSTLGLNRFSLRGKPKMNTQWLLYCVVHNLFKVHRYGPEFV